MSRPQGRFGATRGLFSCESNSLVWQYSRSLRADAVKALQNVTPTPEQLEIVLADSTGVCIIYGSAGSGKTTSAILRLDQLNTFWAEVRETVVVSVLTYNRTLRGYIKQLAEKQVEKYDHVKLDVSTFAKWAASLIDVDHGAILDEPNRRAKLVELGRAFHYEDDFISDEVDYALGRYSLDNLAEYITAERRGRGAAPRVDAAMRRRIIEEIILPYESWKTSIGRIDWNDIAVAAAQKRIGRVMIS
jgi:superfamily I DNA/RNA helicase